MSPLQTTILIIAVVTIMGVVISFLRKSSALAGYDEIKAEVPRIASALKAEMFRDGEDLVMTGNYKGRPAMVRFSYSETTPGLNLRMQAPVSFTFSTVPKGAKATEGRVLLRTGNDMFDAKFASRTDHPTQAKMLVGSRPALQSLEKLCCSQKTFLTMTRGSIELSELVIPTPYTSRHVIDHLEAMSIVAKTVEDIPGAENVKVEPYTREKSAPVFRLVLAAGAVAAVLGVLFIRPSAPGDLTTVAQSNVQATAGVDAVDASRIGQLQGWHAMQGDDYAPDVRVALRDAGFEANGSFTIDLDGDDRRDVVYALASDDGRYRIVVLKDGDVIYDTVFRNLKGALPVPKDAIADINWSVRPRSIASDGGGVLLLTQDDNQNLQPSLVMFSGNRVLSGIPADWQRINLR